MALRSLKLLLQRLKPMMANLALQSGPDGFLPEGGALELLPVEARENFYWPPLASERQESLLRTRRRLLRHRPPLTSFYPSRRPSGQLPALPVRPEKPTPGQKRRWRRTYWLVNWANNEYRRQEAFPPLEEDSSEEGGLFGEPSLNPENPENPEVSEESEESEELIDGWLPRSTVELLRNSLLNPTPATKPGMGGASHHRGGAVHHYGDQKQEAPGRYRPEFTSELLHYRLVLKDSLEGLESITPELFSDPELSETESFQHLLPEVGPSEEGSVSEDYSSGDSAAEG